MSKYLRLLLVVAVACLFYACSSSDDDGVNINQGADNKTDVAVTGAVYRKGLTHAEIYGYVNLDKLPSAARKDEMGIEIWYEGDNYPHKEETSDLTNSNRLDISFTGLKPATEYTYRTYVETNDGTNFYGEKETFTTNDNLENVVVAYDAKEIIYNGATLSYTVDFNKFPSDQIDAKKAYIGLAYSYSQSKITEENISKGLGRTIGRYSDFVNLKDNKSELKYELSADPDSTVYYAFFTEISGKIAMGPVKKFICQHLNLETSGAVDLGLSVKWAACNLGASSPWRSGDLYAWGETSSKYNFDWDNYKWHTYNYSNWYREDSVTKYTLESGLTTLTSSDDAATANLGSEWRMPTYSEQKELIDKCKWTEMKLHGINGYYIVGSNGNAIFLPASDGYGSYYDSYYWSSSLYDDLHARCLMGKERETLERYRGCYIRPVHK